MSIHKSKGLEFPVVFTAGLGKQFNRQDARSTIAIHQNYGVGCDCVDPVLRFKTPTLLKRAIQQILLQESLGEELRVLYVAMTRAKEKLYLSGSLKKAEDTLKKWSGKAGDASLPYLEVRNAASMLEWILRAVLYEEGKQPEIPVQLYKVDDLYYEKQESENRADEIKEQLKAAGFLKEEGIPELCKWLTQETAKTYPFTGSLDIQGKLSVSEIKRHSQMAEEKEQAEGVIHLQKEPEIQPLVPQFLQKKEEGGAVRGTAMHHLMQRLDFTSADTVKKVEDQIEALIRSRQMTAEEKNLVSVPAVVHFFRTDLGKRAAEAAKRGQLFREKQFVIGVPASQIRPQWDEKETVLVQGIIDLWFYEGDEIVLADYKTDRVYPGQEELLKARYQEQLAYYEKALIQTTGCRVKEKLIYSFALQKTLCL